MKPIDLSNTAVPGCLAATDGEAWETLKTRCKITWVAAAAAEEAAGRAWEALGRAAALPGPWREREEAYTLAQRALLVAMGESCRADHEAEKMLVEVEKALGNDPAELSAFMETLEELPEMADLIDELGRHRGWLDVSVDYYTAD